MNVPVLVFVWMYVFISLGDGPRSELLGHVVALCLHFRVLSREVT